jgi:tripartite-type tricarboxylate transporter receptor subunit TctC
MKLFRREFLHLAAGAVALPVISRTASAQTYPTRPVVLVVGFAPGSTTDILARLMGQWLSQRLGQQFVIENRPGAGGNVGAETVVKAAPDGYTLLMVPPAVAANETLYQHLDFNFIRDTVPVAGVVRVPNVVEVNPSVPVKTIPELIAYAKAHPLSFASAGIGTASHLAGQLFNKMAGVNLQHVPYRGDGPAMTDLVGGQVQVGFATMTASIGFIRTNKLRPLAGDHDQTLRRAAGHPERQRLRAGLRGELVVRHRRAEGNAGRNHRKAQPGNQRRSRRCDDQGAARRYGRDAADRLAGRLRQAHRRRNG